MTNQEPKAGIPAASPRTRGYKLMRIILYICVATGLLLALLPMGVRLGTQYWLNKQPDIEARIDNIDLNLFTGSLAVYGVRLRHKNAEVFRLDHLCVEMDYLPLWDRHLFIRELRLGDAEILIEQRPAKPADPGAALRIGGILVPRGAANDNLHSDNSAARETSAWGFGWNQIILEQTSIVYRQPAWQADLDIESISTEDGASWNPAQVSTLKLALRINDAPVRLDAQGSLFAQNRSLQGHVRMDDFALKPVEPMLNNLGVHDLEGRFSCDLHPTLGLDQNGAIELHWDGTLSLHQGAVSTPELHLARAELRWEGQGAIDLQPASQSTSIRIDGNLQLPVLQLGMLKSGLALTQDNVVWQGRTTITLEAQNPPSLHIRGNLSSAALTLRDQQRERLLLSCSGARLLDLEMAENLSIAALNVEDLVALRPGTSVAETEPALVQCGTLNLLGLETRLPMQQHGPQIELNTLHLNNLGVSLLRYPSGHTNIDQWLTPTEQTHTTTGEAGVAEHAPAMIPEEQQSTLQWRVNRVQIDGHSQVEFQDAAIRPQVNLALHNIDLSLETLNSAAPEQRNPFQVHAEVGRFSTLNLHGAMSLLAPTPQGNLQAELQGFELFSISPYIEAAMGSRIDSGELDCTATASVAGSQLTLQSHSTLRGFALGEMPPEQRERIAKNLGMPLSLALALLRDRQGNIHLDIPVTGDLSSPDIALGSIIRTALLGAVQETIKLALAPLGILSQAGRLVGIGTRLELPPLPFPAASAHLENPAITLEPLRDLLEQRPQLRVKFSAPLTHADVEILHQSVDKQKDSSAEKVNAMALQLQQQRLHAVKQWLLDAHGVTPNQVLLTQPDSAIVPGAPRVEMRF